jgi:hypothetical protein
MRFTLLPLSKKEQHFVLQILNLQTRRPGGSKDLADLESAAREYSTRAFGKYLAKGSVIWRDADEAGPKSLRNEWALAQQTFHAAIVDQRDKPGLFCHLPALGLPTKRPPALITTPMELSVWLVARAVAHGQHRLFVKCARKECGKFGRRRRARASSKYCSAECQIIENARRAAERPKAPNKIKILGLPR